ncbi:Uma2 family endonuclease [Kitasatospora sp. MAA19]|uniref:Uma2 family endonuclease n=1 Tax=Kitasatospora sp. MAA19 TaxID=3035090 RepID=UPI002475A350|nr:Uma2 family endonuclease [Kitasatospora sp. MAA19]MDH6706094.1 Uma2 family endonuclease [Kitasatospora sp. MAA19]
MSVVAFAQLLLPDSPYAMWVRGELGEYLRLPDDGTRVEVIGGEIVVSPAPVYAHGGILSDIQRGFERAWFVDPAFPWRGVQAVNLDLIEIGDGYIPDMVVVSKDTDADKRAEDVLHLRPHELELVVEVTSSSNARHDRRPMFGRQIKPTKWSGYARTGVPYYLLVDRDPRQPGVTLFGEPNRGEGMCEVLGEWKFGESVRLPEPFDVEISTDAWKPWSA